MIGRMLSIEFPGLDIIRQQLNGAVVVAEYRNDPAIELRTPKDAPPLRGPDGKLPTGALPVELITPQGEDGAIVGAYLLLHEGRLAFLELYRMDAGEHISKQALRHQIVSTSSSSTALAEERANTASRVHDELLPRLAQSIRALEQESNEAGAAVADLRALEDDLRHMIDARQTHVLRDGGLVWALEGLHSRSASVDSSAASAPMKRARPHRRTSSSPPTGSHRAPSTTLAPTPVHAPSTSIWHVA